MASDRYAFKVMVKGSEYGWDSDHGFLSLPEQFQEHLTELGSIGYHVVHSTARMIILERREPAQDEVNAAEPALSPYVIVPWVESIY